MLWWEELTGLLQSQPALLKREVSLRQGVIATTLEQLTSDDVLTFNHMEKLLSDVQATLTEGLQQCTEGKMCQGKWFQFNQGKFIARPEDNRQKVFGIYNACSNTVTQIVTLCVCHFLTVFVTSFQWQVAVDNVWPTFQT